MGTINRHFENQDQTNEEMIKPANKYLQKAKDLAGLAATKSSDVVKEYPGYSVLGAAALGFIAGAYLTRKRS
jgi:ElaB/YqjD/DUF883 family membrane-anchored ribosome-binding protein